MVSRTETKVEIRVDRVQLCSQFRNPANHVKTTWTVEHAKAYDAPVDAPVSNRQGRDFSSATMRWAR